MSLSRRFAKSITDYTNPNSLGSRFRRKRTRPLIELIEAVHKAKGSVSIVDAGGTTRYWRMFPQDVLRANNVHITLVNLPGAEKREDEPGFTFTEGDACDMAEYADNAFDIVHSNSVVEHVGDWPHMVAFAKEVRRLAPNYFVQTPNFWFFLEPHFMTPFFHWLPEPTRIWLIRHFELGHVGKCQTVDSAVRAVQSARLLDKRMFREIFPDAEYITERLLGLPKSMVAVRRAK